MTKDECEEYLLDIPKFKKKTLLSDTKRFYEAIGSPAKDIPIIHAAGTNGKGSTCFYISRILEKHGMKTALFTSPHLVRMNERFVFEKEMIDDESFVRIFEKVKEKCIFESEEEKMQMHPSFFEFLFLMFMEWAEEKKPDAIVLETGLGGMLDATNIFDKPALTVICSIGMDHVEQLGNTIEEIAFQKAGIIQKNVPLVLWDNGEKVNNVILSVAKEKNSKVYLLKEENISKVRASENRFDFSLDFEYDSDTCVRNMSVILPTNAVYQRINSSMAILAAKVFLKDRFEVSKVSEAVSESTFKGRLEEIADGFFVDGAHNEDAVDRLLETVSGTHARTLIFGACKDKDFPLMLRKICDSELFDHIILTKVHSQRAADTSELKDTIGNEKNVIEADDLAKAVDLSRQYDGKVVIAGSLYLVGEAIAYFDRADVKIGGQR